MYLNSFNHQRKKENKWMKKYKKKSKSAFSIKDLESNKIVRLPTRTKQRSYLYYNKNYQQK